MTDNDAVIERIPKTWVIVPAAGSGQRMKAEVPKQYLDLNGKTIIEHTLERLLDLDPARIVVAVNPLDDRWERLPAFTSPLVAVVRGGAERVDSVYAGLSYLEDEAHPDDWAMVHDVARPCVQLSDIRRLRNKLKNHPVGGILATPASDTIKWVEEREVEGDQNEHEISETLDRERVWSALTPQIFRYGLLKSALEQAMEKESLTTDEAHAVELMGRRGLVVEGRRDNIKITRPEDLAIAAAILNYQETQGS